MDIVPVQRFAGILKEQIEAAGPGASAVWLILFSTVPGMSQLERLKLLDWGTLMVANHAPADSVLLSWDEGASCLLLLRRTSERQAEQTASSFAEQLNKLPVYRVAPGNGWSFEVVGLGRDRARFTSLLEELTAGAAAAS